jgi:hypothetical protein
MIHDTTTADNKDEEERYITSTAKTSKGGPFSVEIGPTLEDQYLSGNYYTSTHLSEWEHSSIHHPIQSHTLYGTFHRNKSLDVPACPKANVLAPSVGCPLTGPKASCLVHPLCLHNSYSILR